MDMHTKDHPVATTHGTRSGCCAGQRTLTAVLQHRPVAGSFHRSHLSSLNWRVENGQSYGLERLAVACRRDQTECVETANSSHRP